MQNTQTGRRLARGGKGSGNGKNVMATSARLEALLHAAAERDASDVHLVPGYAVTMRVHGNLEAVGDDLLETADLEQMLAPLLREGIDLDAPDRHSYDSSLSLTHDGTPFRFRANVYRSQGQWCACLRHIPHVIPSFEWLGFPEELADRLISNTQGLVLVTGVTGSGKSATLAALIARLRQAGRHHVLTVEEPIEYLHNPGAGGIVTQREVGRDVESFADGLRSGLRQDPDVILIGEIRDRDTAQMALSAAETGHLIFATMHTRDAKGALTRLVDLFPHESQDDIRAQLALSLRSVVSQRLLPAARPGEKRVLVLEVLHNTPQVQVAVRGAKIETIESNLQTGKKDGMLPLDEDLMRLLRLGRISPETARRHAKDPASIPATNQQW